MDDQCVEALCLEVVERTIEAFNGLDNEQLLVNLLEELLGDDQFMAVIRGRVGLYFVNGAGVVEAPLDKRQEMSCCLGVLLQAIGDQLNTQRRAA